MPQHVCWPEWPGDRHTHRLRKDTALAWRSLEMDHNILEMYGGELTSDALLILQEEEASTTHHNRESTQCHMEGVDGPATPSKPDNITTPAHRAVLWPLSEYFQSKFRNWSSTDSKPQITLLIPSGQMHIGVALVTAMYAQLPDNLTQPQLLQLLILAESYKIDKVSRAVVTRISSIGIDKLDWETVVAAEQLPDDNPLYAPVIKAARARYMQLLGDLDLVWALERPEQRESVRRALVYTSDALLEQRAHSAVKALQREKPRRAKLQGTYDTEYATQKSAAAAARHVIPPHALLLQLPFDRLLQLLKDAGVKAASENTVYYTAKRWLEHNKGSEDQQQQLAALLRLEQCTPHYLLSEVCDPSSSWAMRWLSGSQIAAAVAGSIAQKHLLTPRLQCLAPLEGSRAKSALYELDVSWKVKLELLRYAYAQLLEQGRGYEARFIQLTPFRWQGIGFWLSFSLQALTDRAEHTEAEFGQIKALAFTLDCQRRGIAQPQHVIAILDNGSDAEDSPWYLVQEVDAGEERADHKRAYVLLHENWDAEVSVPPHVVVNGPEMGWARFESELRERRLVHDDGCLHVTATITQLF